MKVKKQITDRILTDKRFRLGLCFELNITEDHVKKLARINESDKALTLGTALDYYKANGYTSPTIKEKSKNLPTV